MQEQELRDAVRTGDIKKLRTLCEQGAIEAVEADWPDARSYFMVSAIKSTMDFTGGAPKLHATGHTEIVAHLLQLGANVNYVEETDPPGQDRGPLHWAATYGDRDIAALLIQHGADVNAKWEPTGDTPLGMAIHSYEDDDHPLDEATEKRLFDTMQLLVNKGADVNARNNTQEYPDNIGETVLFRTYNPKLIKYLVDKGADVNARNNMGWTPLHGLARYMSDTRAAEALIECGADVNAVDKSGKTPLDLALSNDRARNDQMKELLQSYQTPMPMPTFTSPPPNPAKSGGCMGVLALVVVTAAVCLALIH